MDTTAQFLIAQYFRDPIRREPKNVGLFVIKNGECVPQFLGDETKSGDIHLGRVPWAREPKTYRKWVRYWREKCENGGAKILERSQQETTGNFGVIYGGKVTDTDGDTAAVICDRMFPFLVGETPEQAAESAKGDAQHSDLQLAVHREFASLGILGAKSNAANPIWENQPVVGKRTTHEPAFLQQDAAGVPRVMEVINFTTTKKSSARDHAGIVAKMFDDIVRHNPLVKPVAITRASKQDLLAKPVKYALDLLQDSVDISVNWEDEDEKNAFLKARREAAYASSA